MNEIQRKAAAAGFIHALRESPEVRDEWVTIRKNNDWKNGASTESLRVLVHKTLGLAETPSEKDLEAMRKHSQDRLMPQLNELQQTDNRIEPMIVCNGADGKPGG
jgi:hypothetical protein